MKHLFFARVEKKQLKIIRRTDFNECIENFDGQDIQITVEKKKKNRSLSQNNFFWGVVIPIVREGLKDQGMKMSKEETCELLKAKFLMKEMVNEKTGEVFKYLGSTATLTTTEFMEFISDIQQFAAEYLNIQIPAPGEQLTAEL